jgi:hypothetical protein
VPPSRNPKLVRRRRSPGCCRTTSAVDGSRPGVRPRTVTTIRRPGSGCRLAPSMGGATRPSSCAVLSDGLSVSYSAVISHRHFLGLFYAAFAIHWRGTHQITQSPNESGWRLRHKADGDARGESGVVPAPAAGASTSAPLVDREDRGNSALRIDLQPPHPLPWSTGRKATWISFPKENPNTIKVPDAAVFRRKYLH